MPTKFKDEYLQKAMVEVALLWKWLWFKLKSENGLDDETEITEAIQKLSKTYFVSTMY